MIPERAAEAARLLLILLGGVVLQTVLAPRIAIGGAQADVFLVSVVLVAISRGWFIGVVFAFAAGLAADVVFMDPLGLRVFIYLIAGYAAGRLAEQLGYMNTWLVVTLAGGLSLLSQFTYAVFQFIASPHGAFFTMLWVQVLPSALLGALLAVPLYLALVRLGMVRRWDEPRLSFR